MNKIIILLLSIFATLIIYLFTSSNSFFDKVEKQSEFHLEAKQLINIHLLYSKSIEELILFEKNSNVLNLSNSKKALEEINYHLKSKKNSFTELKNLNDKLKEKIKTKDFKQEELLALLFKHKEVTIKLEKAIFKDNENENFDYLKEKKRYDVYLISSIIIFILIVVFYLRLTIKNQEKLKKANNELENTLKLFDTSNSILIKSNIDEDLSINYISKNSKNIIGYDRNEFKNKKITLKELIHPLDKDKVLRKISFNIKKQNINFTNEPFRLKKANGDYIWVHNSIRIIKDDQNKVSNIIGYITDITEYKNKEDMLIQQSKLASMGEMIGNIAHQWRQPLNTISMIASGVKFKIEHDLYDKKESFEELDKIVDFTVYLSEVIDDFRQFLRTDKEKKEFSLNKLLEKTLTIVDSSLSTDKLNIVIVEDKELYLKGFPNELIQVFINILSNANDAFGEFEVKEKIILVKLTEENNNVSITINDNAGGIKDSALKSIFEPYFTTKHQSQGTGLGLYMSYKIITESFSGKIEASNKEFDYKGKNYLGAEFKITLPIQND